MYEKNRFLKLAITAFVMLFPTLTNACPSAADLAEVGTEPGAAALADCLLLAEFDIETGHGVVQGSIYGSPETDLTLVGAAEEALVRSGHTLSDLGELGVDPVEVYMSPTAYTLDPEDFETDAIAEPSSGPTADSPHTCIMVTFPTLALDEYKYVISHEFFHCAQFSNFGWGEDRDDSTWWVEGSAEWFATLTYQGSALSDEWVAKFDDTSATTPLTQMKYSSVVFFWWLSQNFGNGRVIGLLNAMNETEGSQEDLLASVISEQEFLQFVTDYLDMSITQPGGRGAASAPRHDEIFEIEGDQDIRLEARRFVAFRAALNFACGEWTITENAHKGRYKAAQIPGGEWQQLPPELHSDSEAKIKYLVAGAATGGDGFSLTFEAKKTPCVPCQTPDYSDGPEACLIGEWHLASGGPGAKIGEMLNQSSQLSDVDYPDIDGLLVLRGDGSFTVKADDNGSMKTRTSKGIFSGMVSLKMEKEGTWSVNGHDLVQCYRPIKSINIDATAKDPEGITSRITASKYLGPPLSYTEKRQFTCSDGKLEITQRAILAPTVQWLYKK